MKTHTHTHCVACRCACGEVQAAMLSHRILETCERFFVFKLIANESILHWFACTRSINITKKINAIKLTEKINDLKKKVPFCSFAQAHKYIFFTKKKKITKF